MKPIGVAPPRCSETDRLKKVVWAEQCNQRNKLPIPKASLNDQMGALGGIVDEPHPFDCCECGESFRIGNGFVCDGQWQSFWCELCFRRMVVERFGLE